MCGSANNNCYNRSISDYREVVLTQVVGYLGALLYSTLVNRSKVSFSCKCFPVLLARSIHFPLNHLIVGLRRRSLASTLATKVMSPPLGETHI